MHEQFPWLWESVCGQAPCPDWPESLLPHHPDTQGEGGHFILLYDLFSLRLVQSTLTHIFIMFETIYTIS